MLKNKCCLYIIISIRFFSITICNLLIEFPSYLEWYIGSLQNNFYISEKIPFFPVRLRKLKKFRKSHDKSLYNVARLKNTAVETAWINKYEDQCILEFYPQIPRHCKWQPSDRDSKILGKFFLSHVSSNYCLSKEYRLQTSILVSRNTLIYAHKNSSILMAYIIRLDWLNLLALWGGGYVELILM